MRFAAVGSHAGAPEVPVRPTARQLELLRHYAFTGFGRGNVVFAIAIGVGIMVLGTPLLFAIGSVFAPELGVVCAIGWFILSAILLVALPTMYGLQASRDAHRFGELARAGVLAHGTVVARAGVLGLRVRPLGLPKPAELTVDTWWPAPARVRVVGYFALLVKSAPPVGARVEIVVDPRSFEGGLVRRLDDRAS